MKKLEELAVKFLQNDEYRLKIRKAGVFLSWRSTCFWSTAMKNMRLIISAQGRP